MANSQERYALDPNGGPYTPSVPGDVPMVLDANGYPQPVSATNPLTVQGNDTNGLLDTAGWVWSTSGLQWVKETQPSGGSGGSVTVTNFPAVQSVSLPQLATQYDQSSYPVAYLGQAAPGSSFSAAVWSIQQLTFASSGGVSILWANGSINATNVWNNRASLSYS